MSQNRINLEKKSAFLHHFVLKQSIIDSHDMQNERNNNDTKKEAKLGNIDILESESIEMAKSVIPCIRVDTEPDTCLKEVVSREDVLNKIKEVRSKQNQYKNSSLYHREWLPVLSTIENIELGGNTKRMNNDTKIAYESVDGDNTFTVLQFNTLAEGLSSGPTASTPFEITEIKDQMKGIFGGFTDIPFPEISLDFQLRRWRIIEVILGINNDHEDDFTDDSSTRDRYDGAFDIIAMQEVDRYYSFFQPILKMFRYEGLCIPKPNSPCVKLGWYSDGCALFWKRDKFELIDQVMSTYDIGTQVYIIATLRNRCSERIIVVATTHLKAKKNIIHEKIRIAQADQLMDMTMKVVCGTAEKFNKCKNEIPVIIMGDLNTEPLGESEELSAIQSILSQPKSRLQFASSYDLDPRKSMFTTWKTRGSNTVRRIIDYIFYTKSSLPGMRCTHILSTLKNDEMEETKLPGFRHPSDHISIGAKFEFEIGVKIENIK